MDIRSFKGGAHVPHSKSATEALEIKVAEAPEKIYLSMRQHIGAPAKPLVNPGDHVLKGQVIGEAGGFVSAPVHSSVSGTVKKITSMKIQGVDTPIVEIDNDFKEEWDPSVSPRSGLEQLTAEDIRKLIAQSGIVGMGGAGFPLHVKVSPPPDKKIETIILNGAECEPYLTSDHRLMLEDPDQIVQGLLLLMRASEAKEGYIGIETNKMDAIDVMTRASAPYKNIHIVGLVPKYPQGAEKQLINAITKKEVPSGGLPLDVGVVVSNVSSAKAVADYIVLGIPSIERVCTVTGSGVKEPGNFLIKTGVMLSEIINQAKGVTDDFKELILGGPMMGNSATSFEIPSTKTTGGLLLLNDKDSKAMEPTNCIRCGRCVEVCPMNLLPLYISKLTLKDRIDLAEAYHPLDCIECGSCSYICPSRRPLVHSIRVAKRTILENRRKQA